MEKLKLIGEDSQWDIKDYKIISEAANAGEEKKTYIQGPFTEAGSKNRNQRIYPLESMVEQINEFNQNYILTHRATGELEHPEYPNLNAANACHLITEIKQDGNVFIGKSKILDTPKGQIVKALLHDGVQLGVSSRSLGSVDESTGIVTNFKLCTFDIVHDPSCQKAYVNGIMESKEWLCNYNEKYERVYEEFEDRVSKLPKRDLDHYLLEQVMNFLDKL